MVGHRDPLLAFPQCVQDFIGFTNFSGVYYRPQTKLRKGNVFTPVSQSFCSWGVSAQCMLEYTSPWADTGPGQTPSLGRHSPLEAHPPGSTHLPGGHYSRRYASYWNAFLFTNHVVMTKGFPVKTHHPRVQKRF